MPIHLPDPDDRYRIFRGAPDSPFLAPRGVYLHHDRLLVSDTGHNRVFIWHHLPEAEYQAPDVVLGQMAVAGTGRNQGHESGASTLQYPSGLWTDGNKLLVADAWNHRVLIWHQFPTVTGQPADTVLGQPDFSSNQPNRRGVGHAPSARSLYWPYGLTSDGERLWVADTGNRRVLYFHRIPTAPDTPADEVIGKDSFEERDYDHRHAIWPYSVKLGPGGEMAITDTQYYRVLLWRHWESAFREPAATLVGQPNWEANGQNQFGLMPRAHTLNWCYDCCFEGDGLWVADTGNSRLLWYSSLPQQSDLPASGVLGPPDFTTGSENNTTIHGTEDALYWPFSVAIQPPYLALADTGNHRVILVQRNPT